MHIKKLKVNTKKAVAATPCTLEMASVMSCWATRSIDDQHCAIAAKALSECMAKPVTPAKRVPNINYHLARLGKFVL
ncbi:hypothetical protein BJ085DRAFT_17665 [Dimargaris cristalligena]|uniref:37S ribosomal protein mrp10, mitochondrial n=1 Tax=Dimargaris cristalligena TaxID=215637 RepID=A0A4P9ZZP3_9FUNG|nr:hypothetical protein BJ085DRAFT_17665 [Dimargaris cristalligena]|eukprot:RKP38422.1 hypothetical protein BJ085DRAFT_17665 [Dimargaris cristalligena]